MDEKEYVELRGTVEQIVFSNEENGYAVLRLLSQEGAVRDQLYISGIL